MNPNSPAAPLARALAEEAAAITGSPSPEVVLEPPAQAGHGDLASPLALALARGVRRPPREIAEALAEALRGRSDVGGDVASAEVAGPGFVNLTLTPAWFAAAAVAHRRGGARATGAGRRRRRSRSCSSSSRPTPPARCWSATRGTPPTATRWPGCWSSPGTG